MWGCELHGHPFSASAPEDGMAAIQRCGTRVCGAGQGQGRHFPMAQGSGRGSRARRQVPPRQQRDAVERGRRQREVGGKADGVLPVSGIKRKGEVWRPGGLAG